MQENGIYRIRVDVNECLSTKNVEENVMIWHRRFGHLNYQSLCKMRDGGVSGMKFIGNNSDIEKCEICPMGKQHRLPFDKSKSESSGILDIIHTDLCGPMENLSIGKAKYFLTFIDDHSRKTFVYFLKSKSEVFKIFKLFKTWAEKQTERFIKVVRSDGGGEYTSNEFQQFFKENGIQHQKTNPYTPQQNGIAERMNRTIVEKAKCMLADANLGKEYWAESVNMAVHLINRTVNSHCKEKTPEELWSGKKVDVSGIKLFGSEIMVHVAKEKRKKWDFKSKKCIFVGYDTNTKGFRCIDPKTKQLSISRDVIFHEKVEKPIDLLEIDQVRKSDELKCENCQDKNNSTEVSSQQEAGEKYENQNLRNETTREESIDTEEDDQKDDSTDPDYKPTNQVIPNIEKRQTRAKVKAVNTSQWWFGNLATVNDLDLVFRCDDKNHADDPVNFNDLSKREDSENWVEAMEDEIKSLNENKTWNLVELPKDKKAIKTKWIFKTKKDLNGKIVRHKARLVAKGYSQRYGVDYEETYAPVVRYTSIRFLMALAARNNLKIHQMDVVTAFLQGDINEEVYLEQPEGFSDNSNKVCKLNRAIYGLKQAGRQWNVKLDETLKSYGLKNCVMDPCIYYDQNLNLIIAIYVDDFLIFYKDEEKLKKLKQSLSLDFKMKDMGTAKGCLGIRINQTEDSIELDQSIYVEEILKRFGMEECKPVKNPADTNVKLSNDENMIENVPYQQAVGCLLFLAQATRPDISFAVNNVSRFNNCHSEAHWNAVKRIMRYLKSSICYKLCYTKIKQSKDLIGYADADWAADIDTRKSCTGYIFKLSGGAISWRSTKQKIVALSSTEAEYIALAATVQEAIWLTQLSEELGVKSKDPITIFCDNQSAIQLSESDGYRQRSKHIDIRYHFIRNVIKEGKIKIVYINTKENVADSLTKAVTSEKFNFCSNKMGLIA